SNILAWVWNDTHHRTYALGVAQIHNAFDIRHAPEIHRLERAQVAQQTKSGLQLAEERFNLFRAELCLIGSDLPGIADLQQVQRFFNCNLEHITYNGAWVTTTPIVG